MRISLDITTNDAADLTKMALISGFLRKDPTIKWSEKERKEPIKWVINRKIREIAREMEKPK